MNDLILKIYHRLPGSIRSLCASLHGARLNLWRYGQETEQLVEEAMHREHWSLEKWKSWQEERLAYILHRAATQVPFYREQWARRRRKGDQSSWEELSNWPVLQKEEVRRCPKQFLALDSNSDCMYHEQTSGTTGTSIQLWRSRPTMRERYALFEARHLRWYGVSRRDRWAMLGGQLVARIGQRKPPFWVWNSSAKQLYMSSYHLAPDLISHYVDALRRYRIRYLWGYSSSLCALAQGIVQRGLDDLKMAVVVTNAEPLYHYQRQIIEKAFSCPVRETYGMAELVAAASECEEGQLHLWPEVGLVEVMQNGGPAPQSESGELVCTGLLNPDMPLIRYRTGDRGALLDWESPCDCGRSLPRLAFVEGRVDDVLYTADGRPVGRLDPVFKEQLHIHEAQIIQDELTDIRVRYVPTPEWTIRSGRLLVKRLRERMGNVNVELERVGQVPRSANGKFRSVISNISASRRRSIEADS